MDWDPVLHPFRLQGYFYSLSLRVFDPLLSQPALILNTWPGTSYVTSYLAPVIMC